MVNLVNFDDRFEYGEDVIPTIRVEYNCDSQHMGQVYFDEDLICNGGIDIQKLIYADRYSCINERIMTREEYEEMKRDGEDMDDHWAALMKSFEEDPEVEALLYEAWSGELNIIEEYNTMYPESIEIGGDSYTYIPDLPTYLGEQLALQLNEMRFGFDDTFATLVARMDDEQLANFARTLVYSDERHWFDSDLQAAFDTIDFNLKEVSRLLDVLDAHLEMPERLKEEMLRCLLNDESLYEEEQRYKQLDTYTHGVDKSTSKDNTASKKTEEAAKGTKKKKKGGMKI